MDLFEAAAAADRSIVIDISQLGEIRDICVTESGGVFRCERGALHTTSEQFFQLSKTLSRPQKG